MKNYLEIKRIGLVLTILFTLISAAAAQQLKPTEIVYSRLPTDLLQSPTGANSPTIWAVGQDGANDRMITAGMEPRISDDGRFLLFRRIVAAAGDVFHYNPYASQAQGNLWVRDLANNSETMIFDFSSSNRRLFGYYFSPESNQGNYQIILDYGTLFYKFNLDGTNGVALDPYSGGGVPREGDFFPVLRRGDDLIVANNRDRANFGLMTRTLGSDVPFDMPNTTGSDYNPSWSNDNQFVGFTTLRVNGCLNFDSSASGCNYPYFFNKINKIKPDGSNRALLSDLSGSNTNGIAFGTIWTDDNSKIIAAARIGGVAGLYAFKTDSSGTYTRIPISSGNAPDFVGGIVQTRNEQTVISNGGGNITDSPLGLPESEDRPNSVRYSMDTTIGEPIIGDSSGGSFSFGGGFFNTVPSLSTYEADVSIRPNGDGYVDADDIQQIRRFAVGLDTPYFSSDEAQRADDAPRSTGGDGYIDSDDAQQARRFAVGLDIPQKTGGAIPTLPPPVENVPDALNFESFKQPKLLETGGDRAVRIGSFSGSAGQIVTVPIKVDTAGGESGYTFSLSFDQTKLTATSVTIGNLGGDVVYNINNKTGAIGFSVTSFAGTDGTLAAADDQTLVTVTFKVAAKAVWGTTNLTLSDALARRKVTGTEPTHPLAQPEYTNGAVMIDGKRQRQ